MTPAEQMREDAAAAIEQEGAQHPGAEHHYRIAAEVVRAFPLPEAPPALAEALRQHEQAIRDMASWDPQTDSRAPDPRPRVAEARAALLAAMAPAQPIAGLDLGAIERDHAAATAPLIWEDGSAYQSDDRRVARDRCAERHVPALLAAFRASQPDREALLAKQLGRVLAAGGADVEAWRAKATDELRRFGANAGGGSARALLVACDDVPVSAGEIAEAQLAAGPEWAARIAALPRCTAGKHMFSAMGCGYCEFCGAPDEDFWRAMGGAS